MKRKNYEKKDGAFLCHHHHPIASNNSPNPRTWLPLTNLEFHVRTMAIKSS